MSTAANDAAAQDDNQGDDCLTLECPLSSKPPPPLNDMESANVTLAVFLTGGQNNSCEWEFSENFGSIWKL